MGVDPIRGTRTGQAAEVGVKRIRFTLRSRLDLIEIGDWLSAESPAIADRFIDAVEDALTVAARHPAAGRLRPEFRLGGRATRSLGVKGFPSYLIFYTTASDWVLLVRVFHGARDLGSVWTE